MHGDFIVLDVFEYSTEAQLIKSKLDSEGIQTMLMDEKTIDADPLLSQAVGGVKLLVHNSDLENALEIYNEVRSYVKDDHNRDIHCPECNSIRIIVPPAERKNFFFMLFPFFEKRKFMCNDCKTVF